MAVAKSKKPVPKFSAKEIKLANACAVLIWNGVSYESGKEILSDRDLLIYFSHELAKNHLSSSHRLNLSRAMLHDLIIVSLLKPMYRKQNELSYSNMENYLRRDFQKFIKAINTSKNSEEKLEHASQLVRETGKAVVLPNVSAKAGYRIPFASRLLFFAAPQILIFNYANRLAEKKMNYQSRPHYAYKDYAFDLLGGLRKNWAELSKYSIPTKEPLKAEADIKIAYKTHWWARRVLDIALLIRFGVFKPIPDVYMQILTVTYKEQGAAGVAIP